MSFIHGSKLLLEAVLICLVKEVKSCQFTILLANAAYSKVVLLSTSSLPDVKRTSHSEILIYRRQRLTLDDLNRKRRVLEFRALMEDWRTG